MAKVWSADTPRLLLVGTESVFDSCGTWSHVLVREIACHGNPAISSEELCGVSGASVHWCCLLSFSSLLLIHGASRLVHGLRGRWASSQHSDAPLLCFSVVVVDLQFVHASTCARKFDVGTSLTQRCCPCEFRWACELAIHMNGRVWCGAPMKAIRQLNTPCQPTLRLTCSGTRGHTFSSFSNAQVLLL